MSRTPKSLTIATSDSGGCAGIQADLKTFSALNTFGMSVIVALTSQNTMGVTHIMPASVESIATQIDAVLSDIGADGIKTGMLFNSSIITAVAESLKKWEVKNIVIDPVMVSSTGHILLEKTAINSLVDKLFPFAGVITPNIPEAEVLSGIRIFNEDDRRKACKTLADKGAKTVLIKGGHTEGREIGMAEDLWYDGKDFHSFKGEWIETRNVHGTGCTYSAAIAANIAKGLSLYDSIVEAKEYIAGAIKSGATFKIGSGDGPVDHFWRLRKS